MNQVILMGNLTATPELRQTPNGKNVLQIGLATNESYLDKNTNQKVEKAEFHSLVFWGKLAETIEKYCEKGQKLLVQGKLQTRSWEREDKTKAYKTEILVNSFEFCGSSKNNNPNKDRDEFAEADKKAGIGQDEEISVEDIPFR